jgi:hypothetical protein
VEAEMERELNPYASPETIEPARPAELPLALWARGNDIIAHRNASWPRICVVSGGEGEKPMHYPIATHYPWWILVIFFGSFVVCLIVSLLLGRQFAGLGALGTVVVHFVGLFATLAYMAKPTRVTYYLSMSSFAMRKQKLRLALLLNVVGIVVIALSAYSRLYISTSYVMVGVFAGIVITGAGGRFRAQWQKILKPVKMHRQYTVLRGAGPGFLSTLPQWPYGPV